jgi:carbon monoxide dehydrogenase subunit G
MIELRNSFSIPAPLDEAWRVLLDIERIAPCMPGASLDARSGDEFEGSVKVKLGAMVITYRGKARIVEQDDATHRAVIEASAKEARGSGTAKATVVANLRPGGEGTEVEVLTSLHVTGKPAQFGRGVMAEVAERLIGQFSDRPREELVTDRTAAPAAAAAVSPDGGPTAEPAQGAPAPAAEAPSQARPSRAARGSEEPIDLLAVAGAPVARRAAVAVGVLAVLLILVRALAGRRSGGRRPVLARGATVLCTCGHEGRLL